MLLLVTTIKNSTRNEEIPLVYGKDTDLEIVGESTSYNLTKTRRPVKSILRATLTLLPQMSFLMLF